MIDMQEVERHRAMRTGAHDHKDGGSRRVLSDNYELVGLLGEFAFAERFGLTVTSHPEERGDKGIDFWTPAGSIDVKTNEFNPLHKLDVMAVEAAKVHADIYVAATCFLDRGFVRLRGWLYAQEVIRFPTGTFPKRSIINHMVPVDGLRPISALGRLMARRHARSA